MLFSPNKRLLLVQEQKTVTKKLLYLKTPLKGEILEKMK
jgi:hypothetical protein